MITHTGLLEASLIRLITCRSLLDNLPRKRIQLRSSSFGRSIRTWEEPRAQGLNRNKKAMRQEEEPPRSDQHVYEHARAQPIGLLLNAPIRPGEKIRAHSIQRKTPTQVQDIHRLSSASLQSHPINEPPHARLNDMLPRSYVPRTEKRHDSLAPHIPILDISGAENRRMALEIEVRVAVCFAKPAALIVDWIEGCAVGNHAFRGSNANDWAVFFVEGIDQTRFAAGVRVVPDPKGGEAADQGTWYAR